MNDSTDTDYTGLDFGDLDFDVTRHKEALLAFARLGLESGSVKPALRARDLALVRYPSHKLLIGVAAETSGDTELHVIHSASGKQEADAVRADVERYFRRHFPGRTLDGSHTVVPLEIAAEEAHSVYIEFVTETPTRTI